MRRRVACLVLLAAAALAQAPSYKDLKYPPLREVRIPEIATATLANGMKLYLVENHELPLVSGFALIRTGNLLEPADKVGLAQITGTVLRSGGTKSRTGDQIDEQLENVAASVESSIGETNGRLTFNALKENTDEVLEVFKELLTAPAFRQDKIDLVKSQLRGSIARRNDEAGAVAAREFSEILYGRDTPYGRRIEYEHLERIGRPDLVTFHQRYYFPANIMLAVQGDFSRRQMQARLEKLFADWTYTQPAVPAFPAVGAKPVPGVYLAAKSDLTQTFFHLGHLGGLLKDPDYPALAVAGDILGGGFSSRLVKRVRTELGWAYNVGASWGANYDHPGLFEVSGSTKSASTTETIRVIREEIERLRSAEVTEQELETAKQTVLNGFVFNFERPDQTLSRLIAYEYYGYPKDFIFQYQKAVAALTRADLLRAVRQHLKPENLTVVAVGKPQDFGQPLEKLGLRVEKIDLTIPELKANLTRGRELLQRVRQALGGDKTILSINDLTEISEVSLQMGGASLKARRTNRWLAPLYFRQDQQMPFGKVAAYSDGKTGWLATPQGVQPMTEAVLKQVQGELFRVYVPMLLSDRDPERVVNYLGGGVVEIADRQGHSLKLVIDEKSGMPLKRVYTSQQMGTPGEIEESYSDWREVAGVRLPFKMVLEQAGRKVSEVAVQEWKLNTGLKAEELSSRP